MARQNKEARVLQERIKVHTGNSDNDKHMQVKRGGSVSQALKTFYWHNTSHGEIQTEITKF